MSEAKEYFIIKRGYYYRPDNCGYTDRPILAGLYTKTEAIQTTHPNGHDGPRDGMFYKHESKCGDADYLAFKAQADRIEELEAKLVRCGRYRDAYAECDRISTQAVRDLETKLAKAVKLMELSVELATWNTTLLEDVIDFITELKGQDDE